MKDFAEAQKISAWIAKELDHMMAWVAIKNQSKNPIYKIILSVVNVQNVPSNGKETSIDYKAFLSVAPIGTSYIKILIHHGMNFHSGIEIAFMDTMGNSWVRNGSGIVFPITAKPYEYYQLNLPLSWQLPQTEMN